MNLFDPMVLRGGIDEEEVVCTLARLFEAKNGSSLLLRRRVLPFREVDGPLHGCPSDRPPIT